MDPIADMLTQIRNAHAVGKETARVPYSGVKHELAKLFVKLGYIDSAEQKKRGNKETLLITLAYEDSSPKIQGIVRVSSPGRRVYVKTTDVPRVKSGYGQAIISTPKGIMTGIEARKQKVGGEYICSIW